MNTDQSLATITPDATISQITAADKQAAELLASIGLSLAKHKNETLRSVCQQRQWSETEVLKWVKKHTDPVNEDTSNKSEQLPGDGTNLSEWIEHLKEAFIHPNLALLSELEKSFPRVHKIHGNQYTWLKDIEWHFDT